MNLYGFVSNNPANRWDYLGMWDVAGMQAELEEYRDQQEELERDAANYGRDGDYQSKIDALNTKMARLEAQIAEASQTSENLRPDEPADNSRGSATVSVTIQQPVAPSLSCAQLKATYLAVKNKTQFNNPTEGVLRLSGDLYQRQIGTGSSGKEWGGLTYAAGRNRTVSNTALSYGDPNDPDSILYRTTDEQRRAVGFGQVVGLVHGHPGFSGTQLSLHDYANSLANNLLVTAVDSNGTLFFFDPTGMDPSMRSTLANTVRTAIEANSNDGKGNLPSNFMRNLSIENQAMLAAPDRMAECQEFFRK